jgi:DNA-binding response OmpR family regulator
MQMGQTQSMEMKKILVVDDEPKLRAMLRMILENRGFQVAEAADGTEGVREAARLNPDLIILDVMMPVMNGLDACAEIRKFSTCPILMLTAKGEDYDQVFGLESGADDYIVKPFNTAVLVARIQAALRRVEGAETPILVLGDLKVDTDGREVRVQGERVNFSRKEYDLLLYLCRNKEISLSRSQILENVWGYDYIGSESTVDTHVNRLRKKLGVCGSYLKTMRGFGYRFEVDHEA